MKLFVRIRLLCLISVLLFSIRYFYDAFRNAATKGVQSSPGKLPNQLTNGSTTYLDLNHDKIKISEKVPPIGWQRVLGSNYTFVVYSAYFVKSNKVRVIASTRRFSLEKIYCTYSDNIFENNETTGPNASKLFKGHVETMNEHFGLKHSGKFITCPLPKNESGWKPKYVSIVAASSSDGVPEASSAAIGNFLTIRYPPPRGFVTDFAVCVKPIYDGFNNAAQFLEWYEFHKLMGVRHFTFLMADVGKELRCVLNDLQLWASEGTNGFESESITIELLSWANYPFSSTQEIRGGVQGLSEAANECVYRHKGVSKYMIFVDLDEMIVPHVAGASNYHKLIEKLEAHAKLQEQKRLVGAYIFQNAFFTSQQPTDDKQRGWSWSWFWTNDNNALPPLNLNTRTIRQRKLQPHFERSKYICIPKTVVESGTHFIWRFSRPIFREMTVGQEFGIVHHYRNVEIVDWNTTATVKDETAKAFGTQIEDSVGTWMDFLKKLCSF